MEVDLPSVTDRDPHEVSFQAFLGNVGRELALEERVPDFSEVEEGDQRFLRGGQSELRLFEREILLVMVVSRESLGRGDALGHLEPDPARFARFRVPGAVHQIPLAPRDFAPKGLRDVGHRLLGHRQDDARYPPVGGLELFRNLGERPSVKETRADTEDRIDHSRGDRERTVTVQLLLGFRGRLLLAGAVTRLSGEERELQRGRSVALADKLFGGIAHCVTFLHCSATSCGKT